MTMMTIEVMPRTRIAYVRRVGAYGPDNAQAMESLKNWAKEMKLMGSTAIFGIVQDNPQTTLPEHCRYDACIALAEDYQLDVASSAVVEVGELTGGHYAVYTVEHTTEQMQGAWAAIFPMLHSNGWQIDSKPMMERYRGELVDRGYCELCIPVKPLKENEQQLYELNE